MLKGISERQWFRWALVLVFLVSMFLLPLLPSPVPQQQAYPQPNYSPQKVKPPVSPDERLADYTEALAVFTALLAIVSGFQVWLLIRADAASQRILDLSEKQFLMEGRQADILEKQKEIGRRQFFAEHRPKLEIRFVQRLRANPNLGGDKRRVYVEFSVINTGTSPATITGSRVRLDWFYVDDVPNPDQMAGSSEIIPARRMLVSARQRCSLDAAEENSFAQGFSEDRDDRLVQANLLLLGWVAYHDDRGTEWGDTRTTYFCRAWDAETERFAPIPQLADWEFIH